LTLSRYFQASVPPFWLYTQALIVVFVTAGIVIALVHLL
jgi:hypothetical protein